MQKLLSIYLDVSGYSADRPGLRFSNSDIHGRVEELIPEYLADGWKVASLTSMKGSENGGWIVVVLERD